MSRAREYGGKIGEGLGFVRFLPATNNYEALVRLPALLFQEYAPDPERMYERGEVLRMPGDNVSKYLIQNDGKIQLDKPPPENSLCKLFRNAARADWVEEEFCERGFVRTYDDGKDYVVIVDTVDDKIPPPNSQSWALWEE